MSPDDLPLGLTFLKAHFLLHQALMARVGARLEREHGIEVRDLIALSYVAWGGVNTPSDLARELQIPKYEVSRSLDRLAQLGIVSRSVDLNDARRTRVHLTEKGHDFHLAAIASVQEGVQPILNAFPSVRELLAGLEHLGTLLAEHPNHPGGKP